MFEFIRSWSLGAPSSVPAPRWCQIVPDVTDDHRCCQPRCCQAGAARFCPMLSDATRGSQILPDAGWCYQHQHQCQHQCQHKCQYEHQNQLQYQHRYQVTTPTWISKPKSTPIPIPQPTYKRNQYLYRCNVSPNGNCAICGFPAKW